MLINKSELLEEVKELLEIDTEETIYDKQLTSYLNIGLSFLKNNGVPVANMSTEEVLEWSINDEDYPIIIEWLHLRTLQRFDRTLMNESAKTTNTWIENYLSETLLHLKVRYDHEK